MFGDIFLTRYCLDVNPYNGRNGELLHWKVIIASFRLIFSHQGFHGHVFFFEIINYFSPPLQDDTPIVVKCAARITLSLCITKRNIDFEADPAIPQNIPDFSPSMAL